MLTAPPELGLEGRDAFRREAIRALDALPEGVARLTIDLSGTQSINSAGLNTLITVRRHASQRRQRVRLRGMRRDLRRLFALTKLQRLFEIEPDDP